MLDSAKKTFSSTTKGILIGLAVFGLGCFFAFMRYQILVQNESKESQQVLQIIEQNIEQTIQDSYGVALTLALTVSKQGEVQNFEAIARKLLANHDNVDVLELVPDGIIKYVYPLKGNESVIGYDILSDPKVNNEVKKAAELGSIYFAGPIDLKQGGRAVIGRLPIIVEGELWGYSAVLIYLETLIENSGINEFSKDRYHFQLAKVNPNTGEEEFFLPENKKASLENYESVNFPEGDWRLYITRIGQRDSKSSLILILFFFTLVALLIGFLSAKVFKKPEELEILLHQKSEDLLKSREKFKNNADLFSSVLNSPNDIIVFSIDRNYNYLAFNNSHKEIVESFFNRELSEGMNVFSFLPENEKSDTKKNYDRAFSGEYFDVVVDFPLKDGSVGYWENHFSPIKNESEEVIGLTVFSYNITDRAVAEKNLAESERRYRTLISNSPFCIHELDREGKLLSINDAGLEMMGIDNREDFLGISYDKLLDAKQSDMILEMFAKSLEGESFEFEFIREGDEFYSSFIPLKNENGLVERVMGITQDVTERKRSKKIIEDSLKEKTTLLSEIHHRVKNNLAIVSGLLELQKNEIDNHKVKQIFEQSINRIISIAMVHELMYKSPELSSVNIHTYLDMLIPAISRTMKDDSKDVEFMIDIADQKLNINEAIPLGLLLNELITNSFKYAFKDIERGVITIDLSVSANKIHVLYEDNGKGFPPGVSFEEPKNLGLNLIHAQLQQIESEYTVNTESKFKLEFNFIRKPINHRRSI